MSAADHHERQLFARALLAAGGDRIEESDRLYLAAIAEDRPDPSELFGMTVAVRKKGCTCGPVGWVRAEGGSDLGSGAWDAQHTPECLIWKTKEFEREQQQHEWDQAGAMATLRPPTPSWKSVSRTSGAHTSNGGSR